MRLSNIVAEFYIYLVQGIILASNSTFAFYFRCKTCGEYIYKGRKFNARQVFIKNGIQPFPQAF